MYTTLSHAFSAYIQRQGVFIYKDIETHGFPEMAIEGQDVNVFLPGTSRVQELKLHVQVISCCWEQTEGPRFSEMSPLR